MLPVLVSQDPLQHLRREHSFCFQGLLHIGEAKMVTVGSYLTPILHPCDILAVGEKLEGECVDLLHGESLKF